MHGRFSWDAEIGADASWLELQPRQPEDGALARQLAGGPIASTAAADLAGLPTDRVRQATVDELLRRAVYSPRRLEQVMLSFWGDHFHTSIRKLPPKMWALKPTEQRALRRHCLGDFRTLLGAMTTGPAMLLYLDASTNRRRNPNENLARELLELHTLGIGGGYQHHDIDELARVLTGWQVQLRRDRPGFGEVGFEARRHDDGTKEILGHTVAGTGKNELGEVLDLLASHPATARFVADKLVARFAGEQATADLHEAVRGAFIGSRGQTLAMLRVLVDHRDFRAAGPVFKRPMALVVTALRATGSQLEARHGLGRWLQRLAHAPWVWPTPDGPPVARAHWDDDLRTRWSFALALTTGKIPGVRCDADALQRLGPTPLQAGITLAGPAFQWS